MIYLQILGMVILGMGFVLLIIFSLSKLVEIEIVNEFFTAILATFIVLLIIAFAVFLEMFLYQRWFA